jgi:hypothetical protein
MTLLNLLLLPIFALAASSDLHLPEPGRFVYGGEFEVLQKRVVEGVHVNTEEGVARVEELRKQGYACTFAGNDLTRCVGFVNVEGTEAEVAVRVDSLMRGSVLEFAALEGEPSLQIKGETYEEWSVPQAGSFRGNAFDGYRYQILSDGPHKMNFGNDGVVVDENGFSYVTTIQKHLKRFVMATYIISAKLR